jgi:hypothetical protein
MIRYIYSMHLMRTNKIINNIWVILIKIYRQIILSVIPWILISDNNIKPKQLFQILVKIMSKFNQFKIILIIMIIMVTLMIIVINFSNNHKFIKK